MCVAYEFNGGKRIEFLTTRNSLGDSNGGRNYMFIGVEVEKEFTGRDASETAEKVGAISDSFFANTDDGSLDDGVEFQSMPATFGRYKALYNEGYFDRLFKAFDDYGLESSDTAGSHVHVSTAALSHETRRKMCKLMHEVFSNRFLSVIARRQIPHSTWARRWRNAESTQDGDYNGNLGWEAVAATRNDASPYIDKYLVLNRRYRTMEFRIWDSPRTANQFMEQVEFVTALVKYCRARTITTVSQFGFRKYVQDNVGRYPNLAERVATFVPRATN